MPKMMPLLILIKKKLMLEIFEGVVIYSDLKEIAKIDSYSFTQRNTRIDEQFPELPLFTITHPEKPTTSDKERIDRIIKEFCNKNKGGVKST